LNHLQKLHHPPRGTNYGFYPLRKKEEYSTTGNNESFLENDIETAKYGTYPSALSLCESLIAFEEGVCGLKNTIHKSRIPWPLFGNSSNIEIQNNLNLSPHPTFFSSTLPSLLDRYYNNSTSLQYNFMTNNASLDASSWIRAIFPYRRGAFLATLSHGTGSVAGSLIEKEGFRRAACRKLPGCPETLIASIGGDKIIADNIASSPQRTFSARGTISMHPKHVIPETTCCTCLYPFLGHACQCNMCGFGVYLGEAQKAARFAYNRALGSGRGVRIGSLVDLGHVKAATTCPCACGCGQSFVDHGGLWHTIQGYDTLLVRDESLPATRVREWAVADPLRVDVITIAEIIASNV
jgi:hypothetical protein